MSTKTAISGAILATCLLMMLTCAFSWLGTFSWSSGFVSYSAGVTIESDCHEPIVVKYTTHENALRTERVVVIQPGEATRIVLARGDNSADAAGAVFDLRVTRGSDQQSSTVVIEGRDLMSAEPDHVLAAVASLVKVRK